MPKNFEAYVGGTWGPASLKYYYSFTDFFGINYERFAPDLPRGIETDGSQYLDLTLTFPFDGGWAVVAHAGWQKIENLKQFGPNVSVSKKTAITTTSLASPTTSQVPAGSRAPRSIGTSEKNLFTVGDASEGGGKTRASDFSDQDILKGRGNTRNETDHRHYQAVQA